MDDINVVVEPITHPVVVENNGIAEVIVEQGLASIVVETETTQVTVEETPVIDIVVGVQGPQGIQGIQGIQGEKGDDGDTGAAGAGVPVGGTAEQYLAKVDGTNYNTYWKSILAWITSLATSTPTNLTGFIKGNGSVLSADNSTYLTTTGKAADSDKLDNLDSTAFVKKTDVRSMGFWLETPTSADDILLIKIPIAITITSISGKCTGGTNVVGQLQEYASDGTTPADTQAADTTFTTSQVTNTTFSNASIDADDWIGLKITSVSGTVTGFNLTFYYTVN
jgi:hypothetical protein